MSARLILTEAPQGDSRSTSALQSEQPALGPSGRRPQSCDGRDWPRLGVWAAGLPSQAPAHGSAWPVYIPVISEILQASSFKSRHAGEETHQRSERPRETGRRIRAGVRGQPAWPVLPPGRQGPWLVLQELRPDREEEEGGACDLLLETRAELREFAQVGQVEKGGPVCS